MENAMLTIEVLKELQLFQGVNSSVLDDVLERCRVVKFDEGTVLLRPDQENDLMYVLLSGRVSIRLKSEDSVPICFIEKGESIGEMSVHDGQDPSAIVRTETDIEVLEINGQMLLELIDRSHEVARNLLHLLSNRLRFGNNTVHSSLRLQKQYQEHANIDALSSLYNRRWLAQYFETLLDVGPMYLDVQSSKHFQEKLCYLSVL